MNIAERSFELIENNDGPAAGRTVMKFGRRTEPCRATYSGPNVRFGHALVEEVEGEARMVYHALTDEGALVAGKARVSFFEADDGSIEMHLRWKWLDGEGGGISKWREIL
ncbi:MAG: hypothetical protein OEM82_13320 [Acidobacteriota bacterium]|nr:hypothetical protein [Acidobacteriota bacterium]